MAHTIYEPGKPHKGVYHAYVRVSTDKQDIERQKHVITTFLNGGKHEIKWYIDEGYSGRLPFDDRPALNACLKDALKSKKKGGKGHIIIADFSRLSRQAWHAMQFFEKVLAKDKCKLIICDKPAYSNLDTDALVSILGQESMIAQSVAERASSATKQGLARIKAEITSEGFYTAKNGKTVYKLGVHKNMDLARENAGIRVSDDADAFANMWYSDIQYRLNAGHSYRTIAEEFNARGFSTAREGGTWHASTISNIIKRVEGR